MTSRYAPTDVGHALIDAEDACAKAHALGPVLTKWAGGWEATAVIPTGRRLRRHLTSGYQQSPVLALSLLADRVRGAGESVA